MAKKFKFKLLAMALAALLFVPTIVDAATTGSKTTAGISVSPFQQQIIIGSDDTSKTFDLKYTNNTATIQELKLSARDFGTLNNTGGILLEGSNSYTQKYGLSSWLKLGTDTVILKTNETRIVPITIENRSNLAPGGHYGAVVASVNSLNTANSENRVVINQQLLSLILVKKAGGERYDLKLKSISQNGSWINLPTNVRLRFQNPGNVHVVPRGTVKLKNPAGQVLAQGIINSESAFALPESFRELYVELKPVKKALSLPGIYRIEVEYRYDDISRTLSKTYPVRYINLKLYGLLLLAVAIIIWTVRRYRSRQKL